MKSGKSSFVNALLGEDICEVAPDPCTVGIQELVYGESRTRTVLGDNWERISLPKEVLKEISIIDTPGTNSIIRNHQRILDWHSLSKRQRMLMIWQKKYNILLRRGVFS